MLAPTSLDFQGHLPERRADACSLKEHDPSPGPGSGRLEVALVDGLSGVVTCLASSPLQLLAPRPRGAAAWIIAATHGGGLVAGDAIDLEVSVGPGATACLGTQAETKIYRANLSPSPAKTRCGARGLGGGAAQALTAAVGPGGLLALLPDPVSPFAGARYQQEQRFELGEGASLVVLDAVTAGRAARGERWAFHRYRSRNEIRAAGALLLADAVRLDEGQGPPLPRRLAGLELFATVIALGPRVAEPARRLLETVRRAPAAGDDPVLAAASPIGDGLLLRLASRSVEAGMHAIRSHLSFLSDPLDGDPLLRRP